MVENRRPVASRKSRWAPEVAGWLKNRGVKPNTISVFSTIWAIVGGVGFLYSSCASDPLHRALWLILAVLGILGRLLCNLFDGLVAVEGGLKTPTGEIFNDLPDRISDVVLMVTAAYAATPSATHPEQWIQWGWAAATLSVMTAYIRYLGASQKVGHFFIGPMAKQQRMAALIAASIGSIALEPHLLDLGTLFRVVMPLIVVGTLITCVRRTRAIASVLNKAG